jgi:hypothetical protein
MAGMNFLQLQDAVMGDRFDDSQRGDVKSWINSAYWSAWSAERWTFRNKTVQVGVTAGLQTVTGIPTDFQRAESLQNAQGMGLQYLEPRRFYARYYDDTQTITGLPESYTILDNVFTIGPASSETRSDYLLTYETAYTALFLDTDVPLLPEGSHVQVIVFGATATGLKTQNDFTWQFFIQEYMAGLDSLRSDYLSDESDDDAAYPIDPLGAYAAWLT